MFTAESAQHSPIDSGTTAKRTLVVVPIHSEVIVLGIPTEDFQSIARILAASYLRHRAQIQRETPLANSATQSRHGHEGGGLDAQVGLGPNRKPFGGSPAYANYTFGVYNAAAKRTLDGTLKLANTYAELRSHYPPATPMAGPAYPYTPQVNVTNITYGFKVRSRS